MICRDMNGILISAERIADLPKEAQEHIESCADCRVLASAVKSGEAEPAVDTALLDRIRGSVLPSVKPIRPLPGTGVFVLVFLIVCAAAAAAGAWSFGIYGLPVLSVIQAIAIFSMLSGVALMAAVTVAYSMRPGTRILAGGLVFAISLLAAEAVFLSIFHDYNPGRFLRWGTGCLRSGLLCAVPAGFFIWVFVRRGYTVAPVTTGVAAGVLAGVAGLAALELHCPILTIPHVAIWHVGVVIISAGMGAFAGWITRYR